MFFKNLRISYLKVLFDLSKRSLAVFIIHVNPILSLYFFKNILNVDEMSISVLLCVLMIAPLLMYILLSEIDMVMDYLLNPIEKIINMVVLKLVKRDR